MCFLFCHTWYIGAKKKNTPAETGNEYARLLDCLFGVTAATSNNSSVDLIAFVGWEKVRHQLESNFFDEVQPGGSFPPEPPPTTPPSLVQKLQQ